MHSTKISQMIPLHWSVILRWATQGPRALLFGKKTYVDLNAFYFVFLGNAYNAHDRCVCAGYDNGDIKLFDLKNMSLRWENNVKNGVSALVFTYFFTFVLVT